jgi:hypothetical protein
LASTAAVSMLQPNFRSSLWGEGIFYRVRIRRIKRSSQLTKGIIWPETNEPK